MKNKMENDNNFTTSDFYTAALLIAEGYKLLSINKADSRRYRFIFVDQEDRVHLVSGYFDGLTDINIKAFVSAIKELKSLMYNDAMN